MVSAVHTPDDEPTEDELEDQFQKGYKPSRSDYFSQLVDPIEFVRTLWPELYLYNKQRELMYSVCNNDETLCPAGNMLGKDFTAALIVLYFYLSRYPCRIVTTSVDATQLNVVLWGEMRRFIQNCSQPLLSTEGGPLVYNHSYIRRIYQGKMCGLSYILGRVATQEGEGMLGHHIAKTGDGIPRTLGVFDESSGVPHIYYEKFSTWADRMLAIGNCFPCDNFFKFGVKGRPGTNDKGGDIPRPNGKGFWRKIIRITAEDSPNVIYGLREKAKGLTPSNRMVVDGVKSYADYEKNRQLWDKVRQCVSLDADWYEGSDVLLYPPNWLNRSESIAAGLKGRSRKAEAIGCDPAEGGDNSCWSVIDKFGLIKLYSRKTPNTSDVYKLTLNLMKEWNVPAEMVMFDRGGGGQWTADRLREAGYNVRTVAFGETATSVDRFKKMRTVVERKEEVEVRTIFKNRRAEMYYDLRTAIDPDYGSFALPAEYAALRQQMAPLKLDWDEEGKFYLPSKNKRDKDSKKPTLREILGCSPDELDSLAVAHFAMTHKARRTWAGAIG